MVRLAILLMVVSVSAYAESTFPPGSVQARYSIYDYPVLPENLDDILRPSKRAVCDTYKLANVDSPIYQSLMKRIDRTYQDGTHKDFFFDVMLTLDCYPFRESFFDTTVDASGVSHAFGNMMRTPFGGVDLNAFVRLKREGKVFEGPLYHVWHHLYTHYRDSDRWHDEYRSGMRRLDHPSYRLNEPKSLDQIRKENPDMPISLPLP